MAKRKAKRDVHQEVTDTIVAALEAGTAPWVKPWNGTSDGIPCNASTGKRYNGVNVFLLWLKESALGYSHARWMTYKQAQSMGGQVRKGEKGTQIVFFKWSEFEDKDNPDKKKRIPFLRYYTVFNVDQIDDLPEKAYGKKIERNELTDADRIERAEAYFAAVHAGVGITPKRGGNRACYSPSLDEIRLPEFASFKDASAAYSTEAHEFAHATGHESRLKRDLGGFFGSESYAAEELVAEMTSAFICAELQLDGMLQHPEYIGNWIKVLKGNKRALFTAASLAKKAHAFLNEKAGVTEEAA